MAKLSHETTLPEVERYVRLFRFRCVGCGYGASCKIAPARCPMCGGKTWEYESNGGRPRNSH